jgi:anti-sigma28 factor (negative regulator of flagellin synthesis)
MRITDALLQTGAADAMRKVSGVDKNKETKSTSSASPSRAKDVVSLSKDSQDKASETERAQVTARAKATPDIRHDRIADVKEKIASGYYNTDEFKDKLAEKLTQHFM